jgi:putative OPT family oligopeptide transporter
VLVGLKGSGGMFIALIVGAAVCTALSTSGALISDFKIGYWIGATPRNQQIWKFLGMVVAALVVAFVIPLMDSAYHFLVTDPATGTLVSNEKVLPAPQANMLAAVARGFIEDPASQPWLLYGLGAFVAIVLYMVQLPMLAFALGMYLPISINLAVLSGAFVAWLVGRSGADAAEKTARTEQGTLIASGLMAGAAIFGILTAILRQTALGAPIRFISIGQVFTVEHAANGDYLSSEARHWFEGSLGQGVSLVMFVGLAVACWLLAKQGAAWFLAEQAAAQKAEGALKKK